MSSLEYLGKYLKMYYFFSIWIITTLSNLMHYMGFCDKHRDGKTHIIKRVLKFICNDIAMIGLDLLSYPTTHSMTDIDNQLVLVPVSLQMFSRPIAKTDKRVTVWRQNFIKAINLCQEYCHTKWACHIT